MPVPVEPLPIMLEMRENSSRLMLPSEFVSRRWNIWSGLPCRPEPEVVPERLEPVVELPLPEVVPLVPLPEAPVPDEVWPSAGRLRAMAAARVVIAIFIVFCFV